MTQSVNQDLVWAEPQSPDEIIEELRTKHNKNRFYVLYSGGKDSGSVLHYITKEYPDEFAGAVFTNTGIASPITRKFVVDYLDSQGIDFEFTWARKSYYDIVLEHGFPSAGSHRIIMGYLKFQAWYYYLKEKIQAGEKACFISGVRKKESMARDKKKFYSKKPIDINATMTFAKPFLYKNGNQLSNYSITNDIKKSPAYEWFDKSGECWCGCFYNEWELKMLEKYDPFVFNTIKWLENQVQLYGTPEAKKHPHWGRSVGAEISEMQETLDQRFIINDDYCGESCEVMAN